VTPTLPQDAKDTEARRKALEVARDRYRYSYTYPPEVAWADEVPKGEGYTIPYLADYVMVEATLKANHVAADLEGLEEFSPADHERDTAHLRPEHLRERLFSVGASIAAKMKRTRFESVEEFERFFGIIERPAMLGLFTGSQSEQDRVFAWQRVAGANPMVMRGVDALPDKLPVTEAHFLAAMGEGDSLAAALAEGRAFVADYAHLDGLPAGENGDTPKFVFAPIALFVRPKTGRDALCPVAIQCGQRPGDEFPVFTPADGVRWRMARTLVQMADGNDHETVQHLGRTHCVMEAVVLAFYRNVPPQHPLHVLMTPHFEYTLALNDAAQHSLIAPGGGVDHVLAMTLEASVELTGKALTEFRLDEASPDQELAARGVADTEGLPSYPYRDDGLAVWGAITKYVTEYLALYYPDEASVAGDVEMQAFFRELGARDGGRLGGVPDAIETRAQLGELLSTIVWIASAQHSALNYAQFPFMGMIPNLPGAAYAAAPTASTPDEEASLVALLPPVDVATEHFTLAYQLSSFRRNYLGEYPLLHFKHRAAKKVADAFKRHLEDVELLVGTRDGARLVTYPFMKPSMIAASIHI